MDSRQARGPWQASRRSDAWLIGAWIVFGLAVLTAWNASAAEAAGDPLTADLDRALSARALRGAQLGLLVVDAADGRVLYERHPDRPLVPASNLKILTSLATLRVFGPTHRFATAVLADRLPDADGAVGALYIRGGGDPGLTSEDFWRLAADLRRLGLRRITGDLVLDDSIFDGQRWHSSWLPVSARAYHAPVGGLMVNYGAFAVVVTGDAESGGPVQVAIDPPVDFLRIVNRATTGSAGSRSRLVVDRRSRGQGEEVVVGGTWPAGRSKTYYRSVLDPAGYAGSVLSFQLAGLGIEHQGGVRRGYVPDSAQELLVFEGRPVADIARRLLKYSSNPIGEGLLKALAVHTGTRPGSWEAGARVVRRELAALGLPLEGLEIVDGSGLSYRNRVTPRLLVAAVRAGQRSFGFGPEFLAGLPIAGGDGTLAERAEGATARVRAKTGLLTRVTCLSGLARAPDGRTLAFSVMVNGFRGSADSAMDAVDAVAEALVGPPAAGQDERSVVP